MGYEPELGQMIFGQPWKANEAPWEMELAMSTLGMLIGKRHGANPASNSGARFRSNVFLMDAYSWSDDEQPYNFKMGDIEVSWYKHSERGATCNDPALQADYADLMLKCIPAINDGEIY